MPIDAGDAVILEDLYDAYGVNCYRLAHRMVTDEQLASSIVRAVFLAVWSGESVFDPARGSVQTWLLGATHHRALVTLRRERQWRHENGLPAETFSALPKLGTAHRYVMELAYFGGYSESEIATLTDTSPGTIKTLTLEGLRELAAKRSGERKIQIAVEG